MARVVARKVGPPCELQTLLEPPKDVLRGISENCGLNSCPVPCGRGEQPLKTTLLQEASRPFRACQALKGQTTPASCRRAATRRNLSRKPAAPEIRLSRSPVQWFSGAPEGFGAPSPSRPVRGEFRPHPAIRWPHGRPMLLFNPKCRCRSARSVADPRAGSRPPLAPAYSRSAGPSPGRQNRPGCFSPPHFSGSSTARKTAVFRTGRYKYSSNMNPPKDSLHPGATLPFMGNAFGPFAPLHPFPIWTR